MKTPAKKATKASAKATDTKAPVAQAKTAPGKVLSSVTTPSARSMPVSRTAAREAGGEKIAPNADPVPSDMPARSSRPSARLAQITVPSLPPAVASTAAKASFLPEMTTTVQPMPAAASKKDPKLANHWKTRPLEELTDADVLDQKIQLRLTLCDKGGDPIRVGEVEF